MDKYAKEMVSPIQKAKQLPTFSEKYEEDLKKKLFENVEGEYDEIVHEVYKNEFVHKKRPGELWDVPITEKIEYFDPELSYELTGYRPITMEQGLDFDPAPFCVAAETYKKFGYYTKFPKGCKPYRDFWMTEMNRMKEGYTVGKYRITGDNYYYLNYYRMEVIPDEKMVSGTGRVYDFPSFLSKQYEWFHYVEMAEKLHLDACALKSRGVN